MTNKWGNRPGWHDAQLRPCGKELGIYYFKSQLEVRYASILIQLERMGNIKGWEYEPETWDFNTRAKKPFRAHSQYRPDFRVWDKNGYHYVEATGPLYGGKLTKIKRAVKLFSERELFIYSTRYGTIEAPLWLVKIKESQKRKKKMEQKIREAANGQV